MKKIQIVPLAVIIGSFSVSFAAEEYQSSAKPLSVEATPARILGKIADGTPPPPEPPKPKFIIPAKDVLESKSIQQGGRTITVRKINPIALPPAQKPAAQIDFSDPAVQERIAKFRASKKGNYRSLLVGATVYRFNQAPARSLVQVWPQAQGQPVTVWSSADFSLLSGFSTFVGSAGETNSLMLLWSVTNLDNQTAFHAKFASRFKAPEIPLFPAGKATFMVTAGEATPETLAALQSLHDLYNKEFHRLKTAYEGRERAQRLQEAELKANPPKPKDIVINYWHIDSKAQAAEKGVAR